MTTEDIGRIVILTGTLSALAYLPLQVTALWRMRGAWRVLAALPLLPMVYIIAVTARGYDQGSNLWPILLIFTAPLGAMYLVILMVANFCVLRIKNRSMKPAAEQM